VAFSGLGSLVQNIQNAVSGIANLFVKSNGTQLYPKEAGIAKVLAFKGESKDMEPNWNKSYAYTFAVVDITGNQTGPFQEFPLPLNPSEIVQDENFSIMITPTQGGTVVNHSGNRYKDLAISGTTGISAFRGAGGVRSSTGKAIAQPDDLKHSSGHLVFIQLRNWFRAYYEFKKQGTEQAKNAQLVFKNFKDGEFLIIEVPKFSMKRSSTSPFLYNYTINARVLGNLEPQKFQRNAGFFAFVDEIDDVLETAIDYIDTARGVFLRTQDILKQVESTYDSVLLEPLRKTALAIKAFLGIQTTAADLGPKLIQNTMTTKDTINIILGIKTEQDAKKNKGTLDPRLAQVVIPTNPDRVIGEAGPSFLTNLPGDSLMALGSSTLPLKSQDALKQDQQDALNLPRTFFEDLKAELIRVQDNAADFFNLNDPSYDAQFERIPTLEPDSTKNITDIEYELLGAFDNAIKGIDFLLSTNALFKSSYPERIEDINNHFNDQLSIRADQAVKEIILPGQTSLERLALNELGDNNRWVEIVELNRLKPPYISADPQESREGVRKPGDKILIPQPIIFGFSTAPVNKDSFVTQGLTEVEKNLGIDLKLTDEFDLELSNRGDINLVKGAANAAQAIVFKLGLEKGEIIDHPQLGIGLTVGRKAPPLVEVQTDLVQTLSQDPRFERIENLTIQRDGNTFRVKFLIKIKNVDIPIPVDIKV
jgi:hypothetical protein